MGWNKRKKKIKVIVTDDYPKFANNFFKGLFILMISIIGRYFFLYIYLRICHVESLLLQALTGNQ